MVGGGEGFSRISTRHCPQETWGRCLPSSPRGNPEMDGHLQRPRFRHWLGQGLGPSTGVPPAGRHCSTRCQQHALHRQGCRLRPGVWGTIAGHQGEPGRLLPELLGEVGQLRQRGGVAADRGTWFNVTTAASAIVVTPAGGCRDGAQAGTSLLRKTDTGAGTGGHVPGHGPRGWPAWPSRGKGRSWIWTDGRAQLLLPDLAGDSGTRHPVSMVRRRRAWGCHGQQRADHTLDSRICITGT